VLAIQKRLNVNYRLDAKNLIHAVYMEPGPVTEEAVAEAKELINQEIEKMWEVFKDEK
jgi:hypothetical protein